MINESHINFGLHRNVKKNLTLIWVLRYVLIGQFLIMNYENRENMKMRTIVIMKLVVLLVCQFAFLSGCNGGGDNDSINPKSGSLDTSFGTNGYIIHDNAASGAGDDSGRKITIDNDGNLVVVGESENKSNDDMVVWRYNPEGTIDTTFGNNGVVVKDNVAGGNGDDRAYSIIINDDGKLNITGFSYGSSYSDMMVLRYNPDGTIDTDFGVNGVVVSNNAAGGNDEDYGYAIALDTANNILIGGHSIGSGTDEDMVIWRYDSNGALDTTFDTDGIVVYNGTANMDDMAYDIIIDDKRRILTCGRIETGTSTNPLDMAVWRYNDDGTIDTNFGDNGVVVYNAADGDGSLEAGFGWACTIDTNDNILVTGFIENADHDYVMAVWRYTDSGTLDTGFGDNGIVLSDGAAGTAITLDENGKILVTGAVVNENNFDSNLDLDDKPSMTVWRYNSDGTPDNTFGTNGIASFDGGETGSYGTSIVTDSNGGIFVTGGYHNGTNEDMKIWKIVP